MKRESRANLIFVVLLIGSMIPGVTILIRKKLSGQGQSATLPDPVPHVLAYNQPPPFPPGLPRQEPLFVRDWVQRLTREKVGIDVSTLRLRGEPVVSDAFFTQALSVLRADDGSVDLWLLVWRDVPATTISDPQILSPGPGGGSGVAVSVEAIDIPKDVRHALQDVGYIDPPPKAWIGHWKFAKSTESTAYPEKIEIVHAGGNPRHETLQLR